MDWTFVNNLVTVISRFPIERFLHRTSDKDFDNLAKRVIELSKTSAPPVPIAQLPVLEIKPPQPSETSFEEQIKTGTAGGICSDEHVSTASHLISEALRMARSRGMKDKEIRDRLKAARRELDLMERFDISESKIASYPKEQAEIARWLLPRSATIRHKINEILMQDKGIEELEQLSVFASSVASELTDRIDKLPEEQKESDTCLEVKKLSSFLEKP